MKHLAITFFISVFSSMLLNSCEPRISFDEGQWGDHAFIEDVLLFKLEEEEHQLQEYYESGQTTTGIRRQFLNSSTEIDNEAANITINVPPETDMTNIGIVIRHTGVMIRPMNNAPVPGYLDDFSNGPYTYEVVSTDGSTRDYTITFD